MSFEFLWFNRGFHAYWPLAALSVALASASAPGAAPPKTPSEAPRPAPRYEYRALHDPDGTGKFYMGREIAQVMGHEGAAWLDRPEREREEQPARLLDALKIQPGSAVADVGAGSGYFTFRLAERVGPKGTVYAVDLQTEMLALLRERARVRGFKNVRPVQGTITDPKLPPASVDLVLLVDVYHEFSHPAEMAAAMVRALKPGGRLVLVEYRAEDPRVPIKRVHKMSEAQIRRELSVPPLKLKWETTLGLLPRQHVVVFRKAAR